jgi:hypothetical protein
LLLQLLLPLLLLVLMLFARFLFAVNAAGFGSVLFCFGYNITKPQKHAVSAESAVSMACVLS